MTFGGLKSILKEGTGQICSSLRHFRCGFSFVGCQCPAVWCVRRFPVFSYSCGGALVKEKSERGRNIDERAEWSSNKWSEEDRCPTEVPSSWWADERAWQHEQNHERRQTSSPCKHVAKNRESETAGASRAPTGLQGPKETSWLLRASAIMPLVRTKEHKAHVL